MAREMPRQALQVTLLRFVLAAMRYVWFVLVLNRLKTAAASDGVAETTIEHNQRGMFDLAVERSLRLIRPLVALEWVRNHLNERTILTIGPRTEGEIFNLVAHGFRRKNITAIDLISYSPMITIGDMHHLSFPDGSFDIAVVGWVLAYSEQKKQAAEEILRVVKRGGLIAVGVEWSRVSPEQYAEEFGYIIGSKERLQNLQSVLDLFGNAVETIYFAQDDQLHSPDVTGDILLVFRKVRQGGPDPRSATSND
jgi:SAM-dependent methyltransferase